MTEFDRGMAETAKEMIGDFGFGILEEQSKIRLGKFNASCYKLGNQSTALAELSAKSKIA
jgi:hypothetical protein